METTEETMEERTEANNKYNIRGRFAVKLVAFILCVAFLLLGAASFAGVAYLVNENAYRNRRVSFYDSMLCNRLSFYYSQQLANDINYYGIEEFTNLLNDPYYEFYAENTNFLFTVSLYSINEDTGETDTEHAYTVQNCAGETVGGSNTFYFWYYSFYEESGMEYHGQMLIDTYIRYPLIEGDFYGTALRLYNFIFSNRYNLIWSCALGLILGLACLVFLILAAGRKKGVEGVSANRLDRIPFDLYAALLILLGIALATPGLYDPTALGINFIAVFFIPYPFVVMLALALILSFATRVKLGGFWKNTLIFRILRFVWKLLVLLWKSVIVKIWKKAFVGSWQKLKDFCRGLPVTWKPALAFFFAALINFLLGMATPFNPVAFFFLMVIDIAALVFVCHCSIQYRKLLEAGKALAGGDLAYNIDTSGMYWSFKTHAESLNNIAEGMNNAVGERMKSERFKSELITNVSHDIKTPLTSIINYVDLLKKEDIDGEKATEYLEVLDRQSARLKKLTEDLLEASKLSSGVVAVQLSETDVTELLNQSIGEYSDRLSKAGVEPIVSTPPSPVLLMAEGKHLWRVFDNLLANICKYSLPGTRAYFDLDEADGQVWIMFKNISRELLNISSEELMERFVQGDRSRGSEGNGLGLSIARSLVELQGGTFRLFIDGDLFKVIITFNK